MSTITRKLRTVVTMATVAAASATIATTTVPTSGDVPTVATAAVSARTAPAWSAMLPRTMRKPCASEDSVNCYWNARTMGNGHGHSYVVRQLPGKRGMVCVFYVARRDAARWDYCS